MLGGHRAKELVLVPNGEIAALDSLGFIDNEGNRLPNGSSQKMKRQYIAQVTRSSTPRNAQNENLSRPLWDSDFHVDSIRANKAAAPSINSNYLKEAWHQCPKRFLPTYGPVTTAHIA